MAQGKQGKDGNAHLTYFDRRSQASFIWDGKSDKIEVSIGGYSEPVTHTVPVRQGSAASASENFDEVLSDFQNTCRVHAAALSDYR